MTRHPSPRAAVTREALERYAQRCNAHPSLQSLGVQITFPELTLLRMTMGEVPAFMRGGLGDAAVVNGGVLSALCDVLIGCSCGMVDTQSRSATVQLNIRFERALRGASIQGVARVERATQRLIFASAEISDEQGQVCVRCQGIATLVGETTRRISGRPAPLEPAEAAPVGPDSEEV